MSNMDSIRLVQAVVLPVIVCVALWLRGAAKPTLSDTLLSVLMLIIVSVGFYQWKRAGRTALPGYSLLVGALWIFYGLPCFLDDRTSYLRATAGHILSDAAYSNAMKVVLVGVLAAGAGWAIRIPVLSARVLPPWVPVKTFYLRFLVLVGAMAPLLGLDAARAGTARQLLFILFGLVPSIAFSILLRAHLQRIGSRWDQTLCIIFVAATVLHSLAGGSIGPGFTLAGVGLLTYLHERRRLPVLACVLMVVGFFFLQVGKAKYRQQYWGQSNASKLDSESEFTRVGYWLSQSMQVWTETLTSKGSEAAASLVPATALDRASLLSQTANVVEMTPDLVPFQGLRPYSYMAVTWIPRALWPDKPSVNEANQFYQRAYLHATDRELAYVSIAVGYLAEGFISAGLLGTCVVMFLVGLFLQTMDRKMLAGAAGPFWQALGFCWLMQILTVDQQFSQIFSSIAQSLLIAVAVFRPMVKRYSPVPNDTPGWSQNQAEALTTTSGELAPHH